MVEGVLRTFTGQVGEEETVVVQVKMEALERGLVPEDRLRLRVFTIGGNDAGGNGIDTLRHCDFRREELAVHGRIHAIDLDGVAAVGDALNLDREGVFCFLTVVVVDYRTLAKRGDFDHLEYSLFDNMGGNLVISDLNP